MSKKIEKLNIRLELTDDELRKIYQEAVDAHLKGGTTLKYFQEEYPNGFDDFKKKNRFNKLTGYGQNNLINKVEELIKELNGHKNYVCKYCHKIEKLKE